MHTHGCILFFHTQHAILVQLTTCRPVIVKLNSGVDYRGILACLGTLRNLMFAHLNAKNLANMNVNQTAHSFFVFQRSHHHIVRASCNVSKYTSVQQIAILVHDSG